MKNARVYLDACCIIEAIKGRMGRATTHAPEEIDMIQRLMRAARDGAIDAFTSMLSVSEVLYVDKDERPPDADTKQIIDRYLLSGKDGLKLVSTSPSVALGARSLAWDFGIYTRSIDLLHTSCALDCGATELITLDGRLAKKLKKSAEYRTDDLFGKG
jgi:predicted nucleic acid-binding protein